LIRGARLKGVLVWVSLDEEADLLESIYWASNSRRIKSG
jgi:hypothetical protein